MNAIRYHLAGVTLALCLGALASAEACPRPDINRDGRVDSRDSHCMVQAWLIQAGLPGAEVKACHRVPWHLLDLNCDGEIDVFDVHLVIYAAQHNGRFSPVVDRDRNGCIDSCE